MDLVEAVSSRLTPPTSPASPTRSHGQPGAMGAGADISRLQDHLVSPTLRKEDLPFLDQKAGKFIGRGLALDTMKL